MEKLSTHYAVDVPDHTEAHKMGSTTIPLAWRASADWQGASGVTVLTEALLPGVRRVAVTMTATRAPQFFRPHVTRNSR